MEYFRRDIFCTSEDQKTTGFVERRDLSTGERALRGLKIAGIFLGAAVFAIFVPILHFVLVPGFLMAAAVFGFANWHTKAEISHGEFTCPNCKKTNTIGKMAETFPYITRCAGCSFTLSIDL